ncbi:MAG: hypothetical protein IJV15_06820 [Lachnospiraceae bacterium]|nr:hypothetical protein [Lachnospiraceae bacterium]
MAENIVYQINEKGERIGDSNWTGNIIRISEEGGLWMEIKKNNNDKEYLKRGDMIHYSGHDLSTCDGNYLIKKSETGIYYLKLMD